MEALGVIDNEGRQSEEKLNRSRFNALKHGLTARTAVLPGEDPELFQAVVDVYKARLKTQNEVEDDLAENAALAKWQMTRATAAQRAARQPRAVDQEECEFAAGCRCGGRDPEQAVS